MSRKDQERVTVSVDGKDLGVWDMFTGGATDSSETRHRPGGMAPEVSLGGAQTITNFTLQRLYSLERDHPIYKWLQGRAGIGSVVAKRTMLTRDRAVSGDPITFTGILKTVTPADHDSNAADRKMLSLEVVPDGAVS